MMMTTAAANSRKPMVSESVGSGMASDLDNFAAKHGKDAQNLG